MIGCTQVMQIVVSRALQMFLRPFLLQLLLHCSRHDLNFRRWVDYQPGLVLCAMSLRRQRCSVYSVVFELFVLKMVGGPRRHGTDSPMKLP